MVGLNDGPFPEHYEAVEAPIANPLHPNVTSNPTSKRFSTDRDVYGGKEAPVLATLLLLVVLPLVMIGVFERSRRATCAWLGGGFNDDVEVLRAILSGEFGQTRAGGYLRSLTRRFRKTVVADMLCLIRIQLELSLRGKGLLIARGAGLELPVGDDVRADLEELKYLERTIGPTGLWAIRPLLKNSRRDLWQFYLLEDDAPIEPRRKSAG